MKKALMISLLLIPSLVLAQTAGPVAPTYLDGILAFLLAHSVQSLSAIIGVVAEVSLRIWPTQKALSLLVPVQYAINGLGAILSWLSGLIGSIISVANNVK